MQSVRSRFFNFMMRNRHLFQFKLRQERFDFNTSVAGFRELCEKGGARGANNIKGIEVISESINGMKAEWLIPDGAPEDKAVLYVHGGGYVSGSCSDHRAIISKFAKNCGFKTLLYDYRLAPEHPFPAALEDSASAWGWLLDRGFKPENIIAAGESAGGGLCLALLLELKNRKIALPKAAVAISPWTDLTCSGESYRTKRKVSVAPDNSWIVFSKYYVGDGDAADPLISPLHGDLGGLPPIFINSGDSDELYDDGEKFCIKAKEAGVEATFRAGEGMVHCYPLLAPFFPEATAAMKEICDFIRLQMAGE